MKYGNLSRTRKAVWYVHLREMRPEKRKLDAIPFSLFSAFRISSFDLFVKIKTEKVLPALKTVEEFTREPRDILHQRF